MTEDDVRKVRVAAADLESAEFEMDHATLNLESSVAEAVEDGQNVEDIAQAADMEPSEVINTKSGEVPAETPDGD